MGLGQNIFIDRFLVGYLDNGDFYCIKNGLGIVCLRWLYMQFTWCQL